MSDGKKTDVPGATLHDSVPTETPKLLQQDLDLERRAPRPVPSFEQLRQPPRPPPPAPDLKRTTPYFPLPVAVKQAISELATGPEYANTVLSNRALPPQPAREPVAREAPGGSPARPEPAAN